MVYTHFLAQIRDRALHLFPMSRFLALVKSQELILVPGPIPEIMCCRILALTCFSGAP